MGSGQCLLKIKYRGNHSCIIAIWNWVCCHSNIKICTMECISLAITCSPSSNFIAVLLAEIFSILCFDFLIVTPLWRHQHLICIIKKSWISLEQDEIWQKGKRHSSSLLKAFQIRLFFITSIFHFIGTLIYYILSMSLLIYILKSILFRLLFKSQQVHITSLWLCPLTTQLCNLQVV